MSSLRLAIIATHHKRWQCIVSWTAKAEGSYVSWSICFVTFALRRKPYSFSALCSAIKSCLSQNGAFLPLACRPCRRAMSQEWLCSAPQVHSHPRPFTHSSRVRSVKAKVPQVSNNCCMYIVMTDHHTSVRCVCAWIGSKCWCLSETHLKGWLKRHLGGTQRGWAGLHWCCKHEKMHKIIP